MHRFGLPATVVLVTALAAVCSAQTEAPADVDQLVARYFNAPGDAQRADVLKTLNSRKDITIKQVEDAVRRGVFYRPQRTGLFTRKITVAFDGKQTDCTFYVPPDYEAKKAYPTLVVMHGTGGTGEKFIQRWLPYCEKRGMIVIAPTQRSGVDRKSGKPFGKGHGYGTQELERSTPISAINAARRVYHVDSDRIIITGVSMGGHSAWDSIITRTDTFAGAIPEAGIPYIEGFKYGRHVPLASLLQTRMWVMQGANDRDQPRINRQATSRMQSLGIAVEYRQYAGKGHGVYREESDKALDFVLAGKRDNYAKKITKVVHRLVHGRAYWIRIDKIKGREWDPRKRVEVKADKDTPMRTILKLAEEKISKQFMHVDATIVTANTIGIRTKKVRQLTVFLHDALVDMDKRVRIHVNGRTRWRKKVKRDMQFMLEHVREDYDTGRIFYNEVTINVP